MFFAGSAGEAFLPDLRQSLPLWHTLGGWTVAIEVFAIVSNGDHCCHHHYIATVINSRTTFSAAMVEDHF